MSTVLERKARRWALFVKSLDVAVFVVIIAVGVAGVYFSQEQLAVVSLVLSIVVAYLATVRPLLRKPQLKLFVDEIRCSAPSVTGDTASWFLRLGVINIGLTPAKNCVGRLVGVWLGDGKKLTKFDPLTLFWSKQDSTHTGFFPVDIQGFGDIEYLDIAQVKSAALPLTLRIALRPPMTLSKGDFMSPTTQPTLIAGTYYIQIAVYADEANIRPVWLEISCSENVSECGEPVPCGLLQKTPHFA